MISRDPAPPNARPWPGALIYPVLVGGPLLILVLALLAGTRLNAPPPLPIATDEASLQPLPYSLLRLLGQIIVVLTAARVVGKIFRRIGQPQVVGEMAAGIILGPSVLGVVAPGVFANIFAPGSLDFLQALSHVGLLVFMFLVGLELDPALLRGRGRAAMIISHTSIAVPFALGTILALWLYPMVSDSSVEFLGFGLFLGTAMSITAFPVLARILSERGLMKTRVGALTLACAAIDDVTAWSILAGAVLIVRTPEVGVPVWVTVAGSVAFVGLMIGILRPFLRRFGERVRGRLSNDLLAVVLMIAMLSAATTEALGIHALFGAFLAGAVMPRTTAFVEGLAERLEDVTVVLLLPLFFAFTGLRTRVDLLGDPESWLILVAVVAVAIAGKLGGSAVAARLSGVRWREALVIGTLMNTRGLMELVVLNLGLEIGVISPRLFTIMVLMALATTFMTTPVITMLWEGESRPRPLAQDETDDPFWIVPASGALDELPPGTAEDTFRSETTT